MRRVYIAQRVPPRMPGRETKCSSCLFIRWTTVLYIIANIGRGLLLLQALAAETSTPSPFAHSTVEALSCAVIISVRSSYLGQLAKSNLPNTARLPIHPTVCRVVTTRPVVLVSAPSYVLRAYVTVCKLFFQALGIPK